ncbi:MAG: DNA repair protein RadC [Muribaculaceae bacterium]|nr:DNA repair protein RadC [Muribaculaceae bacterium]
MPLQVADADPADRPREKADRLGFGALTKAELLALILRTGTVSNPITSICDDLLATCGDSFLTLMRKHKSELMTIPGIGEVKAQQILAIMELTKRFHEEALSPRHTIIKSAADIYNLLRYEIGNKSQEEIWIITLSRRNSVIGRHALTRGSATASVFDVKLALKPAILDEASAIIMSHNHPSGNRLPSPQDDQITRKMKQAAEMMQLSFFDHVIVTNEGYYSYADEGRL